MNIEDEIRTRQLSYQPTLKINRFIVLLSIGVLFMYFLFTNGFSGTSLFVSILLGLTVGFFISVFENHSLEFRLIRKRCSFSNYIVARTLNFSIALSVLLSLAIFALAAVNYLFKLNIFPLGLKFFFQDQFHEILLLSIFLAFCINGYLEINRKLGPGVLLKIISGKYHQPQSEERIFLFIDLNDSTNMAEILGDLRFSQLLQDFFYDISEPVNKYGGEIYQYVGDEVVISWSLKKGLKNNNALHCYLQIKDRINSLKEYYTNTYGFIPEFKGGMHCGKVVLAEVGKIKTEIAYHGDVLNTTSRITDLCRSLKSDLLISEKLFEQINPEPSLPLKSLGSFNLKGKSLPLQLYAIRKAAVKTEVVEMDVEFSN